MASAVELLHRHAFVDLETTGLDPARDEVIEVGVLFVERGEPVRRLSRLFRAQAPLPLAIRRITGIRDEELAAQTAFADFVPELRQALEGWTVVAHNAAFECSFLAEVLEPIRAPVLDSCELLHYLFPELPSHSLDALIGWAGIGTEAAHRALHDCEDTWGVLAFALEECVSRGRVDDLTDLLETLAPHWKDLAGHTPITELLIGLRALSQTRQPPLTLVESSAFLPGRPDRSRRIRSSPFSTHPESAPIAPVSAEELTNVLGPGGALERELPHFHSRPEQMEMASAVGQVLSDGGVLAVEAGTGTGKSLAYLAPAALFATSNGRRVGIAPHTKALQDQLVEKDLPLLHRATRGAFGFAVLKGQTNYLCRRRSLEVTRVHERMSHSERAPRAYLRAYLRRSHDGDLDRLSYWFRDRFPLLTELSVASRSEAATTLSERCPHFHRCFFHSAVAQAKAADVIVINQSLAFAWPERYPSVDELVLDEAHELEDVVTSALSVEVTRQRLERAADRLAGRSGKGGVIAALEREKIDPETAALHPVTELRACVAALPAAVNALATTAGSLAQERNADDEGAGFALDVRLDDAIRPAVQWPRFEEAVKGIANLLARASAALAVASATGERDSLAPAVEREIAGARAEIDEIVRVFGEITEPANASRCRALSVKPSGFSLSVQPVDISGFVRDQFAQQKRALILTSATLSAGSSVPWVLQRVGLLGGPTGDRVRVSRFRSPFNLKRQAVVILVTDAPRAHDEAFIEWAGGRIAGMAQFMGGRVLGLFASSRRLDRVGERVRAQLEPLGIEVLRQSHGNARVLAARQQRDSRTVLLGTKSFWQGVDIPGRGVSVVFIDKLPLEPQSRPLVAAREERWRTPGGDELAGFAHYRLPRALLLLRQGVGRLVRSDEDRGVVIIADPGNPSYRQQVTSALEDYRVEALPWAQARIRIFDEMRARGLVSSPLARALSSAASA